MKILNAVRARHECHPDKEAGILERSGLGANMFAAINRGIDRGERSVHSNSEAHYVTSWWPKNVKRPRATS